MMKAIVVSKGQRNGFTLLEVMIAVAILAIALVAVYKSQSQSIAMSTNARFLTSASLLAQMKMAEIDSLDAKEIAEGQGDFGDSFPDYAWRVKISDTDINLLRKVTLIVVNTKMITNNTYELVLYKPLLQ
jgi:general secretion pathway protein I